MSGSYNSHQNDIQYTMLSSVATLANKVYILNREAVVENQSKASFAISNDFIKPLLSYVSLNEKFKDKIFIPTTECEAEVEAEVEAEHIIFPYTCVKKNEKLIYQCLPENKLKENFSEINLKIIGKETQISMYDYLTKHKETLLLRDKGGACNYSYWYQYGRSQGLNMESVFKEKTALLFIFGTSFTLENGNHLPILIEQNHDVINPTFLLKNGFAVSISFKEQSCYESELCNSKIEKIKNNLLEIFYSKDFLDSSTVKNFIDDCANNCLSLQ